MKIVGGVYSEKCCVPEWDQVFGSGGRAAAALSGLDPGIELNTYCSLELQPEAAINLGVFNFTLVQHHCDRDYEFSYFHSLSKPQFFTSQYEGVAPSKLEIEDDVVLRFGLMYGEIAVLANRAVYDPQSTGRPVLFNENGSAANSLAYVLNRAELWRYSPEEEIEAAARELMKQEKVDVVVVKCGISGAQVITAGSVKLVPSYRTERVFKIGSGDIFSAAFTYYWGVLRLDPETAADAASRSVAWYCDTRTLPLPPLAELQHLKAAPMGHAGPIYIAAPFFATGQRWLVEETRTLLLEMGAEVFSPLHEVGTGSAREVASADLEGLHMCTAILALADGCDLGSIFEIGYARSLGTPVVALCETLPKYQLTMMEGTGCEIVKDFSSAICRAYWASIR